MSPLHPSQDSLPSSPVYSHATSAGTRTRTRYEARPELYGAYSVADAAKPSQIELYSAQYYAACTFGGLMACVRTLSYTKLVP